MQHSMYLTKASATSTKQSSIASVVGLDALNLSNISGKNSNNSQRQDPPIPILQMYTTSLPLTQYRQQ